MRRTIAWMVLAAGCGAPGVGEYAEALEQAYCEWETECHQFAAVEDCRAARGLDLEAEYEYLNEAVAAGTAEYDRDAATACLAEIRGRGCEEAQPEPPAVCRDVFRGRIGRNGPCMSSSECAGEAVCGFDPTCAEACCVGACRVLPAPLAEGEACGGARACADGLYCEVDGDTFMPTVCKPLEQPGGPCLFDEACVEAAYCGDAGECTKWVDREAGESCGQRGVRCVATAQCRYMAGPGGSYGEQVCVARGLLGAPCEPLDSGSCVRFDTYCDELTRLCELLPVPGQGCSSAGCAAYATCAQVVPEDVPGTCVALAGAGEACGMVEGKYVQCLAELQCDESSRCALSRRDEEVCPVPEVAAE